jgi:hypothetical protein
MASRQIKNQSSGGGFGQKVQNIASAVGTIKGMYDTGKAIYGGMQVAAPYIRMGLAML